jgi:hypothetical protein
MLELIYHSEFVKHSNISHLLNSTPLDHTEYLTTVLTSVRYVLRTMTRIANVGREAISFWKALYLAVVGTYY